MNPDPQYASCQAEPERDTGFKEIEKYAKFSRKSSSNSESFVSYLKGIVYSCALKGLFFFDELSASNIEFLSFFYYSNVQN
jgi:hypothetical protein